MLRFITWGAVAAAALTVGCSDSDSIPQANTKNVFMTASASGAWADASCTVTGARGTTFGPFVTNFPDGFAQIDNIPVVDLPALVTCTGGRYFDPTEGVFVALPSDFSLNGAIPSEAVLNGLNDNIAVNPFTNGIAAVAFAIPASQQDGAFVARAANSYQELVLPGFPGTGNALLSPPTIVTSNSVNLTASAADVYAAYLLSLAEPVSSTKALADLQAVIAALNAISSEISSQVVNEDGTVQITISAQSVDSVRTLISRVNEVLDDAGIEPIVEPAGYDGSSSLVVNVTGAQGGS